MDSRLAFAKLAVGLAAAVASPAQDQVSESGNMGLRPAVVDAGAFWLEHAPPMSLYTPGRYGTQIGGIPDDFVHRDAPLYAAFLHTSLTLSVAPHVVLPLFGVGLGLGGGGYADSTSQGPSVYQTDGLVLMGTVEIFGIGVTTDHPRWRAMLSVTPAVDAFMTTGHFDDGVASMRAEGHGYAFGLHARAEVCGRESLTSTWWCLVGGPNVLEDGDPVNGAYMGVGARF